MDIFFEPHRMLLRDLLEAGVSFIVIGGYAVNFHGYNRPTGDMDIWLEPTEQNKQKLLAMLQRHDFDEDSIAYISSLNFEQTQVFSMGEPPFKFDFLTKINLVPYEEANRQKIVQDVEGLEIPFLHLNHLILSKINTGRTKDKADIEELGKINREKPEL